jgi:GcrA cell cycle regulator
MNTPLEWNDIQVATLKRLWTDGLSCSQIAMRIGMGCTRNAVIGKVHRLGLSGRITPARPIRVGHIRKPKIRILGPKIKPGKLPKELPPPAPERKIPLALLSSTTCRYPLGDPKAETFGFCGCDPKEGSPYCEFHARLAYNSVKRRKHERDLVPLITARRESNYGWRAA